ncbi:SH3 domain-containing protein [Oscillatoria acuminata]|uniref:SH3 domain-containing protein n=1 Tax=Oscillatoria acuminata PCC 6304 TaxID=56110 RepID=K9TE06_9CYAN|nr:SH3 domain-containing protein [Oscillatoria acuminata]AFY81112.1 SH3 domain-containing protein [Oscillatoria acuminata PCC 6304]
MSSTTINNMKKILGISAAVSLGATVLPATSIAAPEGASLDIAQAQPAQAAPACREVEAEPGLNVRAQPWGEVIGSVGTNEYVYLQNPAPQDQDWVQIQSPMNGYVAANYLSYCTGAAAQQQPLTGVDPQGPISQQPGQMQPGQMQPGQMQPGQMQPGQMQPGQMQPGQMQPGQMQPGQMTGESCRAISADAGLNVRSQPEVGSEVITTLPDTTQVQIQNRGEDGWVPISEPTPGYVAAENLMMCGQ